MGFAGKNELYRPLWIADERGNAVNILEDQVGPFVSGETPGKADRQGIKTECTTQLRHGLYRLVSAFSLLGRALPDKVQQPRLQRYVCLPQFAVVDAFNSFPYIRFAAVPLPVRSEMTIVELP